MAPKTRGEETTLSLQDALTAAEGAVIAMQPLSGKLVEGDADGQTARLVHRLGETLRELVGHLTIQKMEKDSGIPFPLKRRARKR